jgi:hypothetical protein
MRIFILLAVFFVIGAPSALAASDATSACGYLTGLIPISGGPLFLPSYPTAEPGPLHSVAYLYDNAATAIALVGCGEAGRARRIGDAIVAALQHDRFWHDGRLRSAYAAGPAADQPIKLGGWWDTTQNRWLEDRDQVGSDSGNMAWAILALLALDRSTGDHRYRDAAVTVGQFIAGLADTRGAGGFTGGFAGWEPSPARIPWKSTEHNTDIAAAFRLLATATGDAAWAERSAKASGFVESTWDATCGCFDTGTTEDGVTRNPILAIDAQIWPLIAIPGLAGSRAAAVIATVDSQLKSDGGYSYSDAGHGIWTEGTAQVALLDSLLGRQAEFDAAMKVVGAQQALEGGYYATAAPRLATGFKESSDPQTERYYYHRPHLGAAAWAALAERGFNPFTGAAALP